MLRTPEVARRLRACGRLGAALVATLLAAGCGGGGASYSVDVVPGSLSFTAERIGPAPASQLLTATFDGEGLLVGYPAGTVAPSWLEVAEVSHGATTATLSARVVSTGLPAGVYTATLRFVTGKADGSDYVLKDVPVRLEILAPAYELTGATTVTITQAASLADLVLPLTLRTGLDAAQGAACTWTLSSTVPWLTVTPTSGTLASDTALQASLDAEALWAAPLTTLTAGLDLRLGAGCNRAASPPTTVAVQTRIQPKVSVAPVGFTVAGGTTSAEFTKEAAVVMALGEAFASHGRWSATLSTLEQPWASISPVASTGSGPVTIELSTAALASLPAGHHVANLAIVPSDPRIQAANVPITLDLSVPTVDHLAPATTWVGREARVIVRGGGFTGSATWPLRVGGQVVTATVVSPTELRATVPAQASPGRLAVQVDEALALGRPGAELVVLPAPSYPATSRTLPRRFDQMTLDPERQAVLLTGGATGEVLRLRAQGGGWVEDRVPLVDANGSAVSVDGRTVLVFTGLDSTTSPRAIVELDADTLAIRTTSAFNDWYATYSLIAPLCDGRTLLMDSNQWLGIRWYPGFASGSAPSVSSPQMLLTRDRSRVLLRDRSASSYGRVIQTFDASDTAFRARSAPVAFDARNWDVSEDGGRLLDFPDLFDRSFAKVGSLSLPDPTPTATALSPDGKDAYTLALVGTARVLRHTDLRAAAGPYPADATALAFALPANQAPRTMKVSEDGSTLFILAGGTGTNATTDYFHAVPLR